MARETLLSASEVAARVERVAEELEEPLLALRPGIERLARVLDDEAVDTLPDTLRRINEDVLPLLSGLRETQSRVNAVASIMPGAASLLFARRGRPSDTPRDHRGAGRRRSGRPGQLGRDGQLDRADEGALVGASVGVRALRRRHHFDHRMAGAVGA